MGLKVTGCRTAAQALAKLESTVDLIFVSDVLGDGKWLCTYSLVGREPCVAGRDVCINAHVDFFPFLLDTPPYTLSTFVQIGSFSASS